MPNLPNTGALPVLADTKFPISGDEHTNGGLSSLHARGALPVPADAKRPIFGDVHATEHLSKLDDFPVVAVVDRGALPVLAEALKLPILNARGLPVVGDLIEDIPLNDKGALPVLADAKLPIISDLTQVSGA
ncbi:hypothetical protein V5O48_017070 [Marasmius crinis-equi]|uniref:Uncharacterized protein n=1 Tax=Marasmius crinis-equi TaxID=585013 RepID=A0ABR3EQ01_9AGAR